MATWVDHEYTKYFEGGASLLRRGYKCPKCGFFRSRKQGKSNFCEDCGEDLREVQDNGY